MEKPAIAEKTMKFSEEGARLSTPMEGGAREAGGENPARAPGARKISQPWMGNPSPNRACWFRPRGKGTIGGKLFVQGPGLGPRAVPPVGPSHQGKKEKNTEKNCLAGRKEGSCTSRRNLGRGLKGDQAAPWPRSPIPARLAGCGGGPGKSPPHRPPPDLVSFPVPLGTQPA